VNDLLSVARLESGKISRAPVDTDLMAITAAVVEELGGLARDRGHRLTLEAEGRVPWLLVDPQLLRQVILNLVSNAIKYMGASGEIDIRVKRHGDEVHWAIRDSGIGIPRDGQRRLFEKFYRAENALTVETEGTGLGLYMVRLILEQFGGRIWCESEEGQGSTFTFALPLDRGPGGLAAAREASS